MIVIRVEIWPLGDESHKREWGRIHITNDGTGTRESGNYKVRIFKKDNRSIWKEGRVEGYPRLSKALGPHDLLLWCLLATIGYRTANLKVKANRS